MLKSTFFALCALVLATAMFQAIENNSDIRPIYAKDGIADLSSIDLKKEIVSLEGVWSFYWSSLLEPEDAESKRAFVQVPGSWNSDGRFNQDGFATYKLKILLPTNSDQEGYALYFNRVGSAYKLYVNGKLLGGNGEVGTNEDDENPHRQTKTYHLDAGEKGKLELLVQVSNHYHSTAGLKSSILFSHGDTLKARALAFFMTDFFTSCAFLFVSFVTFSVYVFRPDKKFLYLALFMLSIFFYIAGTGENVLTTLFPGIKWIILLKAIHLFMALHIQFYEYLLDEFFAGEKIGFLAAFFRYSSSLYAAIVVFTPVSFFVKWLPLFHIVILLALVYWIFILTKASIGKKPGAFVVLMGVLTYSASVVMEIRYINELSHNPRVVPLGLLGLIFSYTIVYAKAFAESYKLVENAESEKHRALAQAHVEKAAFLAEKERSNILHQTLTDSESISQVDNIRVNLRKISYIVSESGGSIVYGDQGERLFDMDLTLKKISEIFGTNNQLVRCSKAYIVNPSKARKVIRNNRRYELQFINSKIGNIPVGNKYVAEVKNSILVN